MCMALREERTSISLCMCACAGARVCRKSELLNLQHFLPTRDITLRPLCQWDFILMGCYAAYIGRLRLKCDGTRAETRFRLSAIRTSPFKSAGGVSSVGYWQPRCAHQPAGFVLLVRACVLQSRDAYWLPTPSSFPLHFSARASPCAITFQTQSTSTKEMWRPSY